MTEIEDLSIEDRVHEFTRDELGPDELYNLRREIDEVNEIALATRVDIEYRNSLRYDDYWPAFTAQNLVSVLMLLGRIQYEHVARGNRRRADIAADLADTISDNLKRWADEQEVDLQEYLGLSVVEEDDVEVDHTDRMEKAKHDRDVETVTAEAEEGSLDDDDEEDVDLDFGPDATEEKELHPQPQTPDSPDSPTGEDGGDDPTPG